MLTVVSMFVLFVSSLLMLSTGASLVVLNLFASTSVIQEYKQEKHVLMILFALGVVLFGMTVYQAIHR